MTNKFYVFCANCGIILSECFFVEDKETLYCAACAPKGSMKAMLQPTITVEKILDDDVDSWPKWRIWARLAKPENDFWRKPYTPEMEVTA